MVEVRRGGGIEGWKGEGKRRGRGEEREEGDGVERWEGRLNRNGKEGGGMGEGRGVWKVAFWNVARMGNKDKDFWRGLKEWDVMTSEIWVNEKGWRKMRGRLSVGHEWEYSM